MKFIISEFIPDVKNIKNNVISGLKIIEHTDRINDIYDRYLIEFKLKGKRDANKSISKLQYLMEQMMGLSLSSNDKKTYQSTINGKIHRYCKYDVITAKIYVDAIYKNFSYDERCYTTTIYDFHYDSDVDDIRQNDYRCEDNGELIYDILDLTPEQKCILRHDIRNQNVKNNLERRKIERHNYKRFINDYINYPSDN
jgi:hypothetical protein